MRYKDKKVAFVTPTVTHYRAPFHRILRQHLACAGVEYDVISSAPRGAEILKCDTVELSWSKVVKEIHFPLMNGRISYHPVLYSLMDYDLVILMQENKHLLNYILQILRPFMRPRIALMGHGRNFQARSKYGLSERWKRFWATRTDWWFAYTDETRRHIDSLGFPTKQITVFNNSVDISELRKQIQSVSSDRLAALRAELGLTGQNVGVFVGGLYPDKRLEFLIEAAEVIRDTLPEFELLIIGGGQDLPMVQQLGSKRHWMRVLGPQFGVTKVELMLLGHVFLMPGLVGLAILDAGAARLPIATTRFPWHSPEISYLEPDVNGLMVEDWENPRAYGEAVAGLLKDSARREAMASAAEAMSIQFSIESMATNFAQGILSALDQE